MASRKSGLNCFIRFLSELTESTLGSLHSESCRANRVGVNRRQDRLSASLRTRYRYYPAEQLSLTPGVP